MTAMPIANPQHSTTTACVSRLLRGSNSMFSESVDGSRTTTVESGSSTSKGMWLSRITAWESETKVRLTPQLKADVDAAVLPSNLDRDTEVNVTSLTRLLSAIQTHGQATAAFREAEKAASMIEAYERFEEILHSSWSNWDFARYLENASNRYRHILLGLIVDEAVELSAETLHCIVGLLHSKDVKVANCASLVLLSGGENAVALLEKAVEKFEMEHIRRFLRSYGELFGT